MKKLILSLAIVLSLFSCTPKETTAIEKCGETKDVSFVKLSNQYEYKVKSKEGTTVIVDTPEKLEALFNTNLFCGGEPDLNAPSTPDFAKHTLIGVVLSEKEQYTMEATIIDVVENNCDIEVSYYEHELKAVPLPIEVEIQKENPTDFVLIPKTKKPIVFKKVVMTPQLQILGFWSWMQTTGGLAGVHEDQYTTGESRAVKITKSQIIFYTNNKEVSRTEYEIKKGISILDKKEHDFLVYNGINHVLTLPVNKFGELSISDDVFDGFTSIYYRNYFIF
jgi:hypothetical protein